MLMTEFLNMRARDLTSDPSSSWRANIFLKDLARRRRDFAVERHRRLQRHKWRAASDVSSKGLVQALRVVFEAADFNLHSGRAKLMAEIIVAAIACAIVMLLSKDPVATTLAHIAKARGVAATELTVCVLDRPRHETLVHEIRETGARIKFILDGDVAGAIMAASPDTNVDLMIGIGGTPEGVLAACALKCLGGAFYGKLYPRNDDERQAALDAGYDLDRVLTSNDLVAGDDCFFSATGISDGDLLKGVRYWGNGASTQSMVMRSKSGTIRTIDATHQWQKLMKYSALKFD